MGREGLLLTNTRWGVETLRSRRRRRRKFTAEEPLVGASFWRLEGKTTSRRRNHEEWPMTINVLHADVPRMGCKGWGGGRLDVKAVAASPLALSPPPATLSFDAETMCTPPFVTLPPHPLTTPSAQLLLPPSLLLLVLPCSPSASCYGLAGGGHLLPLVLVVVVVSVKSTTDSAGGAAAAAEMGKHIRSDRPLTYVYSRGGTAAAAASGQFRRVVVVVSLG